MMIALLTIGPFTPVTGRVDAQEHALGHRTAPRPPTTNSMPHETLGVTFVPSKHDRLVRLAFSLPDVENYPATVVGGRTFWIPPHLRRDEVAPGPGGGVAAGIGHVHTNGSLHLRLPEERIRELESAEWGERHPTIEGYALVFRPRTDAEVATVFQLIVDAYNTATGRDVRAAAYLERPTPDGPPPAAARVPVGEGGTGVACPAWDAMLADGHALQIQALQPLEDVDLTLNFVYLKDPVLGACALGEVMYQRVSTNLLGPDFQGFWVGVSGTSADDFVPERLWLVQGDKEPGLALKGEVDTTTTETRLGTASEFSLQFLVFFEEQLDTTTPFRIIYMSDIGPISDEYRAGPGSRF